MTGRPGSTLQLRSRAVFTVDLTKEPKETQNDETEDAWETKPNTRSKCDETALHASCRARSDVVMYLSLCVQTTCTLGHGRWAWSWVLNGPSRNSLSVEPSCLKRWSLRTGLLHSFPLACVYVRWKCFYYGLQTHRSWYAAVTRTLQHSSLKLGWLKRLSGQSFVVQDKEPMLAVWLLRPHEVEMIRPLFFLNFCRIIFLWLLQKAGAGGTRRCEMYLFDFIYGCDVCSFVGFSVLYPTNLQDSACSSHDISKKETESSNNLTSPTEPNHCTWHCDIEPQQPQDKELSCICLEARGPTLLCTERFITESLPAILFLWILFRWTDFSGFDSFSIFCNHAEV